MVKLYFVEEIYRLFDLNNKKQYMMSRHQMILLIYVFYLIWEQIHKNKPIMIIMIKNICML